MALLAQNAVPSEPPIRLPEPMTGFDYVAVNGSDIARTLLVADPNLNGDVRLTLPPRSMQWFTPWRHRDWKSTWSWRSPEPIEDGWMVRRETQDPADWLAQQFPDAVMGDVAFLPRRFEPSGIRQTWVRTQTNWACFAPWGGASGA